jgi:methyl-accepting chemotaxis protein
MLMNSLDLASPVSLHAGAATPARRTGLAIRTRLFLLIGIATGSMGGVALAAWAANAELAAAIHASTEATSILAAEMRADMMHDAVRSDVLIGMTASGAAELAAARQDLAAHSSQFEADLLEVGSADLGPDVAASLQEARPLAAAYFLAANQVLTLAGEDRAAAKASFAGFQESFTALEGAMGQLGELIVTYQHEAAAETTLTLERGAWLMRGISLAGFVALGIAAVAVTRSIVGPIHTAVNGLGALANRDTTHRMRVEGAAEMVAMADAFNHSAEGVGAAFGSISRGAQSLSASSSSLTAVSDGMAADADSTAAQVHAASAAAEQVSENVQTVATGIEEMSVAMREVAKSASEASGVATSAVQAAEMTNRTVSRLGDSSAEIGKVVKVITSIAQQTNLLALNATIEAARAGEAGKGFAVVANEVKELARETAKATEDISKKVEAIQADARVAVEAIQQISSTIHQIHDLQSTIASAVEEQTATANEIARNVAEAARGSAHIASSISTVSETASRTTASAASTRLAASDLVALAANLQGIVSQFRF